MKNFLKLFSVLMLMVVSANQVYAQIKDGEATVTQGNTVTVSIGAAYQSTLNRATGINYTWTTSSSAISIQSKTNKTCTIKGNSAGTAKLYYYCSYYIDGFRRTMDFYYDITIRSNTVYVTRIEVSPSSATLEIGETIQLNATAYPTNATNRSLNWTTEDYSVASVSSSGLVTARGAGKVWIWARATDGSGAGNYCVVDVKEPKKVASIELSESEKSLTVGETFELIATVLPEDAYDKNYTLCLMCNEKNPMNCHRYFLISKALEERYGDWLEVRHIIEKPDGGVCFISNIDLNKQLEDFVCKKTGVLSPMFKDEILDNYFGETEQEKLNDFCDRYWNLLHGWKRFNYNDNDNYD